MIGKKRPVNSIIRALFLRAILLGAVLTVVSAAPVLAKKVYIYKDSRGVVHFTDAPTDPRFRLFKVKARVRAGSGSGRMNPALLQPYINAAAKRYRLDPALIKAVIRVESAFDPHAVSWAGAQGLMQLMPGTADMMQVRNAFDPRDNIFGGSRYLRCMLDRFGGDLKLSLAAYNIGPERVARENKIPNVRETQAYVRLVLKFYKRYKRKS